MNRRDMQGRAEWVTVEVNFGCHPENEGGAFHPIRRLLAVRADAELRIKGRWLATAPPITAETNLRPISEYWVRGMNEKRAQMGYPPISTDDMEDYRFFYDAPMPGFRHQQSDAERRVELARPYRGEDRTHRFFADAYA